MKLGIDRLLSEPATQKRLLGKRCALLGHPASVTRQVEHSLDALKAHTRLQITAAFGPQHGMRGDKQDNMIESPNFNDPLHHIPVFSLYGEVRRPTPAMMEFFEVLLFDVQDIGCRIYTYATTLLYLLEACAQHGKSIWILDRPNPAGRQVEGTVLEAGWESFVGASQLIMRHGLTLGELALWYKKHHRLDVDLEVIPMADYNPNLGPGYGWPQDELCWVNPSPNASSLNMARCFAGTVLLEGTTLSEGRGTTVPLEVVGAPDLHINPILTTMHALAEHWLQGAYLRPCYFEPTFHKHQGKLCEGFQIHAQHRDYQPQLFKPFRLIVLFLKALRQHYPDYDLWRSHGYEYETRLPIDLINGGTRIREWIDDPAATVGDLEAYLRRDEKAWSESLSGCLLYEE